MKKCPGCEREIDKYGIVCDYCGKISNHGNEKEKAEHKKDKVKSVKN